MIGDFLFLILLGGQRQAAIEYIFSREHILAGKIVSTTFLRLWISISSGDGKDLGNC